MEKDNTNYQPFADFGMQQPGNQYGNFMPDEPFFNPMAQYEQAYEVPVELLFQPEQHIYPLRCLLANSRLL